MDGIDRDEILVVDSDLASVDLLAKLNADSSSTSVWFRYKMVQVQFSTGKRMVQVEMVQIQAGSGTRWFRYKMVQVEDGSGTRWFRYKMVQVQDGSGTV